MEWRHWILVIVQWISQHLGAFLGVLVAPLSAYLTVYFMEKSKRVAIVRGLYGELKYDLDLLKIMLDTIEAKEMGKIPPFPTKYFKLSYNYVRKLMNECYSDFYRINEAGKKHTNDYGPLNRLLLEAEIVGDVIRLSEFGSIEVGEKEKDKKGLLLKLPGRGYINAEQVLDSLKIQKECIEDILRVMKSCKPYRKFLKGVL